MVSPVSELETENVRCLGSVDIETGHWLSFLKYDTDHNALISVMTIRTLALNPRTLVILTRK